jgi:SIR2-like domain
MEMDPDAHGAVPALARRGASSLDELRRMAPHEYASALDELDPTRARRRLVLLGAGASVDAGLPTSEGLHRKLITSGLPLYRKISQQFGGDVEQAVHLLELIASDSPLSAGMEHLQMLTALRLHGSRQSVPDVAADELGEIVDQIRSTFWLPDSKESAERCEYLAPLIQAQCGGLVATLNYDNTIQRAGLNVDAGSGWADGDVELPIPHPFRTVVLPLHGFLGWELRRDPGQELTRVVNAGRHQDPSDLELPYSPAIVFGASNKLRHYGPFLSLLDQMRGELGESRTVITIGYSWRDPHINDMLRAWAWAGVQHVGRNLDHIEGPARWRLLVGTGPESAELPPLANSIRTHMGQSVEVRPLKGTAAEVIAALQEEGVFSEPHVGVHREFWCGA